MFPVLKGEEEELDNEELVGKALCNYLQAKLLLAGIKVPFFCTDALGWWLQTKRNGFGMGVCIYPDPDANPHPGRYVLMPSMQSPGHWTWLRYRWIDQTQDVLQITGALESIFTSDADIHALMRHPGHPF